MGKNLLISLLIFSILAINFLTVIPVRACKDIVACGDATEGDFNLLMKVRDPSRPGYQIMNIIPQGYNYKYHNPKNGKPIDFKNYHKYIAVTSVGDTIPNIIKPGMCLSDVGISFGDADSNSKWVNKKKYAWDDFDWIRYACEKADTEDEAIKLMTEDVVKKMHAPGVSENLFIVGPKRGVIIEADAYRYKIKEINNGVEVMSNYPKLLWKSQIQKNLPIAWSFDKVVEKFVRNKQAIRLGSIYGIKVVEIGENYVIVKPIGILHALKTGNFQTITKIFTGERKTVGYYSVELKEIINKKAKLRVCYIYKAWEEKMLEYIKPRYGHINVKDMISWARLHKEDLEGLRPMCQETDDYEAVAIYKIPKENYETISGGWFSPNHACSSIFIPFHICNNDIYEPYKTGKAAELCFSLLNSYGHGLLNSSFEKTEDVFLYEIGIAEDVSKELLSKDGNVSSFLTIIDMGMQKQAYITEQIWNDINSIKNHDQKRFVMNIIDNIWKNNYSESLKNMENIVKNISDLSNVSLIKNRICQIALDISKTRIDAAVSIGKNIKNIKEQYDKADNLIKQGKYEEGFNILQNSYEYSNMLILGKSVNHFNFDQERNKNENSLFIVSITLLIISIILFVFPIKRLLK